MIIVIILEKILKSLRLSRSIPRPYWRAGYFAIVAAWAFLGGSCSLERAERAENASALSEESEQRSLVSALQNRVVAACSTADPLPLAVDKAQSAAKLAQTARTPEEWDAVVLEWMQAIAAMQSVPAASPKRVFAQKKVAEYQQNLAVAQQKASARVQLPFDSFNSSFLDEQLLLFLSYVAAVGPPDVLIIGSSRAIQGIDPKQLQAELAARGKPNLKIFNFGVNGATARVVDLILRELLAPEQLPQLIIWADGVRAINSGRSDRTYSGIVASAGYRGLKAGNRPSLPEVELPANPDCEQLQGTSLSRLLEPFNPWHAEIARAADLAEIDANGFLPMSNRFNPVTYYQQFPRVAGRYDGDYQNFNLWGEQTVALKGLAAYTRSQQVPLVFVNLPLTQDYLDAVRSRSEQQFRAMMQQQASEQGFIFVDLTLNSALQDNSYFADPSHLNRFGAIAVSRQLAVQPQIPWPDAVRSSTPNGSPEHEEESPADRNR